ncbi:MAG TPA: hypothetical protein VMS93_04800, partial [Candidatus Saccharimonadales bacterium]|nr:hypothetical protein [Candidatus Saccharimonadales bacterium]
HYHFTPANDQLPGLPLLWSPDGKLLAYFEYRHSAGDPITSSKAVVVAVDGSSAPVPVSEPGRELNTRPAKWLSASELKFKGLKDSSLTGGEESFVWDLRTGQARTEADYLAALAAARAAADSLARAAADSAARAAAPRPAEKEKKERKKK